MLGNICQIWLKSVSLNPMLNFRFFLNFVSKTLENAQKVVLGYKKGSKVKLENEEFSLGSNYVGKYLSDLV